MLRFDVAYDSAGAGPGHLEGVRGKCGALHLGLFLEGGGLLLHLLLQFLHSLQIHVVVEPECDRLPYNHEDSHEENHVGEQTRQDSDHGSELLVFDFEVAAAVLISRTGLEDLHLHRRLLHTLLRFRVLGRVEEQRRCHRVRPFAQLRSYLLFCRHFGAYLKSFSLTIE